MRTKVLSASIFCQSASSEVQTACVSFIIASASSLGELSAVLPLWAPRYLYLSPHFSDGNRAEPRRGSNLPTYFLLP